MQIGTNKMSLALARNTNTLYTSTVLEPSIHLCGESICVCVYVRVRMPNRASDDARVVLGAQRSLARFSSCFAQFDSSLLMNLHMNLHTQTAVASNGCVSVAVCVIGLSIGSLMSSNSQRRDER